MNTDNLYVDHLAWCGLVALGIARRSGAVNSTAQENLFLCRWLATAEKKRLFRRELGNDIRWLLKEGREKGLQADLRGKFEYLWRASHDDLLAQNDLFRLQHIMHAVTLTGISYGVLSESEWEGRYAVRMSKTLPSLYLRKADIDAGFDKQGNQVRPLALRITANVDAVDALLTRAGWRREPCAGSPLVHTLLAVKDNKVTATTSEH